MLWRKSTRFAREWNVLGQRNAYGAILTGSSGSMSGWDTDQFFASGRRDVDRFIDGLSRVAPNVPRGRALDFGCGVGRITRSLAAHFDSVAGVDVAPAMIAQARALNVHLRNCEFVLNQERHLRRFETGRFDIVYSRLVLQHIPMGAIPGYIAELIRVLSASGVLMFQLPEHIESPLRRFLAAPVLGGRLKRAMPRLCVYGYRTVKYFYLASTAGPHMRMSGLPMTQVVRILEGAGGHLSTALPDTSHGISSVRGFEYWGCPSSC